MGGVLIAIEAIGVALMIAERIRAVVEKAQREGRDLSPAELAAVQVETDDLEKAVRAKLAAAAKEGGS